MSLKGYLTIICCCIFSSLFAQSVPPTNLSGSSLRTWLKTNWYDTYHSTLGYDGVNGARSYMYNIIDNHNDSVQCVYSNYQEYRLYDETRAAGTIAMTPINCEHTVPQSFFSEAEPMVSDIHHLFPTYQNWNSTRSNKPFGEISDLATEKWMYLDASQTGIPSSNIELYSESSVEFFEPQENHKGNLARAIFYFYTMYPTQAGDISLIGDVYTLYTWHILDPVDLDEVNRNEAIGLYQGNRNPYILYPDRIKDAWDIQHKAATVGISASTDEIQLSWIDLEIESAYQVYRSTDNISFSLQANLAANTTIYTDNNANNDTTYYYYLAAIYPDGDIVRSDTINSQLSTDGGVASDLFISEYIEGSSYNKAIEIANFTGQSVDLSNYALAKQSNGTGSWTSLALSGNLADQSVYLITNNNAPDADLIAATDLLSSSSVVNFNGNDPIALVNTSGSSDLIIDVVGTENGGASYFGNEITLVRKASVKSPNTSYAQTEWISFSQDNFANAGQHSFGVLLPVELVSFTAHAHSKSNWIDWRIAAAINHHYFLLEKSANGKDFETLARLEYTSDNATKFNFQVEDENPYSTTYYRLQQVDLDGQVTVFPIKSVQRYDRQDALVLYPVPVQNQLNLKVNLAKQEQAQLSVFQQNAQLVWQQNVALEKGDNELDLALGHLARGVYLMKLQTATTQFMARFVKID